MRSRIKLSFVGLASLAVSGCLDLPAQMIVAGGVAAAGAIVAAANSDDGNSSAEIVGYCWDPGQSTAYGSTTRSCASPAVPISEDEYDAFRSNGVAPAAAHYQEASTSGPIYCLDVAKEFFYSHVGGACVGTDKRITEAEWRDLQAERDAEIAAKQAPVYCWDPDLALPYQVSSGNSCGLDRRISEDQYHAEVAKKEAAEEVEDGQQAKQEKEQPAPEPAQQAVEPPKVEPDPVAVTPASPSPIQPAAYAPPELSLKDYDITGSGTGFYVSGSGHILTNHHVVDGCETVATLTGGIYEAKPVDSNARFDLAVLRSPVKPEKFALFAAASPDQGDNVYAIGYPLLGDFREIKITNGIVSGLSGPDHDSSLIQMTAAVQPGNSGGPLLSQQGSVVGVVVGKYSGDIGGGFYAEGINFAVAHEAAAAFLAINGVTAKRSAATKEMKTRDIMKRAEQWTVPLLCLAKGTAQ